MLNVCSGGKELIGSYSVILIAAGSGPVKVNSAAAEG
jgi:hypothetical protein